MENKKTKKCEKYFFWKTIYRISHFESPPWTDLSLAIKLKKDKYFSCVFCNACKNYLSKFYHIEIISVFVGLNTAFSKKWKGALSHG
jgi:hypothetical protein